MPKVIEKQKTLSSDGEKIKVMDMSASSSNVEETPLAKTSLKKKSKSALFSTSTHHQEENLITSPSMRPIRSSSSFSKSNSNIDKSQDSQHNCSNDTELVTSSPVINMSLDLTKYNSSVMKLELDTTKKSKQKSNKKFHKLFPSIAVNETVLNSRPLLYSNIKNVNN